MDVGYTQPSGKKLAVGRMIRYTHESSGIIDQPGVVTREDGDFFMVRVPPYSIEFALHKDNRFKMAKDFLACPIA